MTAGAGALGVSFGCINVVHSVAQGLGIHRDILWPLRNFDDGSHCTSDLLSNFLDTGDKQEFILVMCLKKVHFDVSISINSRWHIERSAKLR